MRCVELGVILATLGLSCWAPLVEDMPTLQDMQIAGHVLHFQQTPVSGAVVLAIVYNKLDSQSRDEADELAKLLGAGLAVGDLTLRPRLVEQSHLSDMSDYNAIFTAAAVDQKLLVNALQKRQVPCLTLHAEQVEQGSCTVAIRSQPNVSITVNTQNAVLAGVRFANAFRMMVHEI